MANDEWRVVLQFRGPGQSPECRRFAGLPVVEPVHIALIADDPVASREAKSLFVRLEAAISRLSPASSASSCHGPVGLECMARREATCRSLLVAVTGRGRISTDFEALLRDWQDRRPLRSVVLPILPSGATPGRVLPPPLDRWIALFNPGAIELLVPDVLRAAGLGGTEHRLFVSYRRADAQELAEQLHEAFSRAGFDVFLDRFSGPPGRSFPRVLTEELADKALVLVVESPEVHLSPWTLAEVAFARALRLGLLALAIPGGQPFRIISERDRFRPPSSSWKRKPTAGGPLKPEACLEVVDFVRARYAEQILRRQLYLENLLHQALARHGLSADAIGGSLFRVSAAADYVLQLSARPPGLHQLRQAAEAAQTRGSVSPPAHPVVVGAHRYLAPENAADLEWLAEELKSSLRSEARLPRMAASLAAGQVPP